MFPKKREEFRNDLREAGDRARDHPGGYAEAPNFHLHGDSDDDQEDRISESESNCSEQWYELDGQEQEALISLRDARKKLQHATKSRRFYPKGGGRAISTGKSIDELKKVTPCNRCGAIGPLGRRLHTACQKPKKRDFFCKRVKEKVVGSEERNLMARDEEVHRTNRLWRSTMMVPPGYAVLECGAAKSLCGAKPVALMAQTCAREGKRVGDERDTKAVDESYHFRGSANHIVSSFMKLRVPGSIDGKEVSFAPSVTPGDIPRWLEMII